MKFVVLLAVSLFSGVASATSCIEPYTTRCEREPTDVLKAVCYAEGRMSQQNSLILENVRAESCMLGHKMNRREYRMSQCKTTSAYVSGLCGGTQILCIPNGNAGQIYSSLGNKVYDSEQAALAERSNQPIIAGMQVHYYKCISGNWQHVEIK